MAQSLWTIETLLAGSWRGASSVLLANNGQRIIVDTGMPHEAAQLAQALTRHGTAPEDVSAVINTHFHVDHVLNNCLFPKAAIYASQQSYEWCRSLYSDLKDEKDWEKLALRYYPETWNYAKAHTHMHKLRKFALRWWNPNRLGDASQFRWLEQHPLPEGLDAILTSGHVPGHVSVAIANGAGPRAIIAGDALLASDNEDRVLTMIPHQRDLYLQERAKLLAGAGQVIPGHGQRFDAPEASLGNGPPGAGPAK